LGILKPEFCLLLLIWSNQVFKIKTGATLAEAAPGKAKNSRLTSTAIHRGLPAFIIRRIDKDVNKPFQAPM